MIRIQRTAEPTGLAAVRDSERMRVRRALTGNAAGPALVAPQALTSDLIQGKYRDFAPEIWRMQHRKCCYCESRVPCHFNDVEHYRPKAAARQARGLAAGSGY